MLSLKKLFLVVPFISFLLTPYLFTFANVRTLERDIEWREPELFHVDDSLALEKLNFRGASYADTLAAIPVYSYITQDRTPLFNHQFQLTQTSFEPVCEQADRILRKAGFLQDSITLHHSLRGHLPMNLPTTPY